MAGLSAGEGSVSALLLDPGGLSAESTEIIQLGTPDPSPPDHLHTFYGGSVERKDPLHTDSRGDLSDREGLADATTPAPDADALERLDAFLLTLTNPIKHPDRIPGRELGHVLAKLFPL
jgi:hypothetical protein